MFQTLKTKLETIKQGARLQSVSNMDGDDDIRYEDGTHDNLI